MMQDPRMATGANATKIKVDMGPSVDEPNMSFFESGTYSGHDAIYFSRLHGGNKRILASAQGRAPLSAPKVNIDVTLAGLVRPEPVCDVASTSLRLKAVASSHDGRVGATDALSSLVFHGFVIGICFGVTSLSGRRDLPLVLDQPVEVSFGYTEPHREEKNIADKGVVAAQPEALKLEQQLPQLPKNLALDLPPPADAESMPLPDKQQAAPKETPAPQPSIAPVAQATVPPTKATPAPVVPARTPPPNTKILTPEELAKRMEKEKRKVGEKEREGVRDKPKSDEKSMPNDLPKSPMDNGLPEAPPGLGPAGKLEGTVSASAKNDYREAAFSHIKRFWSLPDLMSLDPALEVIVVFDVNVFGKVQGKVRVQKASGNPSFDQEATKAIEAANPFPDLPQDLAPAMQLKMRFSPQDIRK